MAIAFTDVTRDNEEATQGFQPFGPLANDDSALLLGFATDPLVDFPPVELNLAVWTLAGHRASRPRSQCGLPDTPSFAARRRIRWEYWNGSRLGRA